MAIEPCGFRLVVQPLKLEEADDVFKRAKALGIEIAKNDDLKVKEMAIDQGTVISIGPTAFKDYGGEDWCKVGDTIAYAKYSGKLIKDPDTDENILVINDEDVVAIVTRSA